jgi:hypothetical protein
MIEVRVGGIIEGSMGFVMDNWCREFDQLSNQFAERTEERRKYRR